ncbi:MAG: right-handed parallel beta-helix repeat-containing protein [Dehalococcoidia bacterium]|nr:right-handed parallel beta-helix repeat-containing protein [Dehalococcoidia bacterium]
MSKGILKLAISTLTVLVALLLAGMPPQPASAAVLTVDDDGSDCVDGGAPDFATIGAAVAAAAPGDTIRVCEGDYTQTSLSINSPSPLTITGPGDTPEADGEAVVHHGGGFTTLFDINASNIRVSGLILDLTPSGPATSGFEISGDNVVIANNEIMNGTAGAMSITGTPRPAGVVVDNNNIHDNGDGVVAYCNSCEITDNTLDAEGTRGIDVNGDNAVITGNTVTEGWSAIRVAGNNALVEGNNVSPAADHVAIQILPGSAVVRGNTITGASGTGISARISSPAYADIDVDIVGNSLTGLDKGIELYDTDFDDEYEITALIGGSAPDANTFRSSGGALGDNHYLLDNESPTNVNAEYNDWGWCFENEIAGEIRDQADDPTRGVVDFVPFIEPEICSELTATPSPTPFRRSTSTPEPTATSTPGAATSTPLPQPTAPLATATATPGGAPAATVIPPPTGSGPSGGPFLPAAALGFLAIVGAVAALKAARRALRH